jgi:hypothetical protein
MTGFLGVKGLGISAQRPLQTKHRRKRVRNGDETRRADTAGQLPEPAP